MSFAKPSNSRPLSLPRKSPPKPKRPKRFTKGRNKSSSAGRRGSMVARSTFITAQRQFFTGLPNNSVPGASVTVNWKGSILSNVASDDGPTDRKTPKVHTYDKYRFTLPTGSYKQLPPPFDFSSNGIETRGVMQERPAPTFLPDGNFLVPLDISQKLISRFYDSLRASENNTAITVAEISQVRKMIESPVMGVISFARKARRKAIALAPDDPAKVIANTWLSYQYGWKPLLGEVFGACDFARTRAKRIRIKVTAKAKGHGTGLDIPATLDLQSEYEYDQSTRGHMTIDLAVTNQDLFDLSRMTTLNPVMIVWELVPYSFVADWFLDIGGYMSMMEQSFGAGLEFKRGHYTQTYWDLYRQKIPPQSFKNGSGKILKVENPMYGRYIKSGKRRVVLNAFPLPGRPRFNVKLGAERLASAASLITQLLTFKAKPK